MGPNKSPVETSVLENSGNESSPVTSSQQPTGDETEVPHESQAVGGAEAPTEEQTNTPPAASLPRQPEPVAQVSGTVTSILNSPRTSTSSFDGAVDTTSLISDPEGYAYPPKVPVYRRLTDTFTRSNDRAQAPLFQRSYGPHLEQDIRSIDEYPRGYGRLAAIEACDPNFLIYRKFSWLHNRLLLHYQDELAVLEEKLERLDKSDSLEDEYFLIARRRDEKRPESQRNELLKRIDDKLAQYHALLLRLNQVDAIRRPTKRNQSSLWHLITATKTQVSQETQWIHKGSDLAAVGHDHEYGSFNMFVEGALKRVSEKATKAIFRSKEQTIVTGNVESLTLLSPRRLEALLRVINTVIVAALLLIPVYILFTLQTTDLSQAKSRGKRQILTIFGFTLLFSLAISILTKARRQEVFTATAAYCAVLVVFLGNTTNLMASGKT